SMLSAGTILRPAENWHSSGGEVILGSRSLLPQHGNQAAPPGFSIVVLTFRCPHCQAPCTAPPEMAGRKAKCLKCTQVLVIPDPERDRWPPGMEPPGMKQPPPPAAAPQAAKKPAAQPIAPAAAKALPGQPAASALPR